MPVTARTRSSNDKFISLGDSMGPSACSSSVSARPSQKSRSAQATLRIVGVLRQTPCMPHPTPLAKPSLQEKPGLWQEAHEINFEPERRGSKKRVRPNNSRSFVKRFSAGNGMESGRRYLVFHALRSKVNESPIFWARTH